MSDSRDPLGKRALFWAPAERVEDDPRRPPAPSVRGKHALFSAADSVDNASARQPEFARTARSTPDSFRDQASPRPVRGPARILGPVTVDCSACGSRTDVDLFEYLLLHLPWWLWRPGRGFTRLMTCPACRRRTWISASLSGPR